MNQVKSWLRLSYGKRLKTVHFWNAWVVLILAVTGIILYLPSLRGPLAIIRVGLKEFHIIVGIVSILILLLYVPLMSRHVKQILKKRNQQVNLWLVLSLLIGWSISGIILWQARTFPEEWSFFALIWHDLFTWIGIPYTIYHSLSRSRWVKKGTYRQRESSTAKAIAQQNKNGLLSADQFIKWNLKDSSISRHTFLRGVIGFFLVFGMGPFFYRWLKGFLNNGGASLKEVAETDGNTMLPAPAPLTGSQPPAGGGAQGNFRVYTVTEIPSFSSDTWKFAIGGLVEKPLLFNWDEFLKVTRQFQVSDFHCGTGWSVYNVTWEGIPLSYLLDQVDVHDKAKYVKFYSGDGVYTDTLSLNQARIQDVMVAVLMDGKPIPQKLGGPVRLVVPKMYAYKSVKWLQGIELIEEEQVGYWEVRGYETNAWVQGKDTENRVSPTGIAWIKNNTKM